MEGESLGTLAPWGEEAPLAQARALLEGGRDGEAEALLKAWKGKGPEEAERLALLGLARARRGDLEGYRRLALEAARRAQTSLEVSRGKPSLESVFLRLFGREAPKEPSP